jgi:hypothetical protein
LTTGSLRYQFVPDGRPGGSEPVLDVLATRFAVAPGSSRVVRRMWLDTFDWRLHKAGWTLEYAESGADRTLAVRTRDGDHLSAAVPPLADAASSAGAPSAGELAVATIGRAYRRVVRLGSAITTASPAEDLHTLRKRGKELRYALEMFSSLYDGTTHRAAVADLKGLQDCLGRFQDSEVQRDAITRFAEQMMAAGTAPAATVLAMGELAAHLEADQVKARDEFAGRFAQFMRRGNRRRMAVLTGAAPA